MTKEEALKILDEVMAAMQNEYEASEIQLKDWHYDLTAVFLAVEEGWDA